MGKQFDRAEVLSMMAVANREAFIEPEEDGTYIYLEGWGLIRVNNVREGYEIGYDTIAEEHVQRPMAFLSDGDRIGSWHNDAGQVILDRTMHVLAPRGVAATIAANFGQEEFYGWAERECFRSEGF